MDERTKAAEVRILRVLWLALLASIFMYGVVTFIAAGRHPQQAFQAAFLNPVVMALHVMGAVAFLLAFIVPPLLLRRSVVGPRSVSIPAGGPTAERIRVALIIKWALIESAAVVGLMAAFIAVDPRLFLPLGGLAVAGMLMTYPSDSALQDMAPV